MGETSTHTAVDREWERHTQSNGQRVGDTNIHRPKHVQTKITTTTKLVFSPFTNLF